MIAYRSVRWADEVPGGRLYSTRIIDDEPSVFETMYIKIIVALIIAILLAILALRIWYSD